MTRTFLFVVLLLQIFSQTLFGFLSSPLGRNHCRRHYADTSATTTTAANAASNGGALMTGKAEKETSSASSVVDVVLFGLGDLRVDDHLGLIKAMMTTTTNINRAVLPLCVLTKDMLASFPGAVAHTVDTARLISSALASVDRQLKPLMKVNDTDDDAAGVVPHLNVLLLTGEDSSLEQCLKQIIRNEEEIHQADRIRIHVCDLGDADNDMQYGAYSHLRHHLQPGSSVSGSSSGSGSRIDTIELEIIPWDNNLRDEPWGQVEKLSDQYPLYESRFVSTITPKVPVSLLKNPSSSSSSSSPCRMITLKRCSNMSNRLPSAEELTQHLVEILDLDETRCQAEKNTGLYATHWGGLDPASVGQDAVLKVLDAYVSDCNEDDAAWFRHPLYTGRRVKRNGLSLEHSAMQWQLQSDGMFPTGNPANWLPGESMVRYLAAPLLLGTVSPRRIWDMSKKAQEGFLDVNPLKRLVEGREWHRLLAARNLRVDPDAYSPPGAAAVTSKSLYKYWRYHGFLARYAETDFFSSASSPSSKAESSSSSARGSSTRSGSTSTSPPPREGVLLVHGFGASGSQWNKPMQELNQLVCQEEGGGPCQGLAPDLLGFGQAEKPAISYTAYLWDSMTSDFVKEVAIRKNGWDSFVVGGNSIGGYTSMSMAACDSARLGSRLVTSSGAPGTELCTGLVLMNSAGPLKTRDEVEASLVNARELQLMSIAQVTALNGLPPCKPPPRPVARAFGNGLLFYLRPRIQSICKNLYPTNPAAVDDALCGAIERDSLDPGAVWVMMAGAKLPTPRTANELLAADFGSSATPRDQIQESAFTGPVLIAQGVLDPLNNATDRMLLFGSLRQGVTMDPLQAGHCPHDELPMEMARSINSWMMATRTQRSLGLVKTTSTTYAATSSSP